MMWNGGSPQGGLSETDSQSPFGLLATSNIYMIWEGRGRLVNIIIWRWTECQNSCGISHLTNPRGSLYFEEVKGIL